MKSLLEEQKRMRELMGFTYENNSHDILSEEIITLSLLNEQLSKFKDYKIINQDQLYGNEAKKYGYLNDEIGEIKQGVVNFSDSGKKLLGFTKKFNDWDNKTEVIKLLNSLISGEDVRIEEIIDTEKSAYNKSLDVLEREKEIQIFKKGDEALEAPRLRGRSVKKGTVDLSASVAEKRIAYFTTRGLNIPGITEKWADLKMGIQAGKDGGGTNWFKPPEPKPDPIDPDPVNIDINFKLSDPFKYDSIILSDKGERQYQTFLENYQKIKEKNSVKWGDYIEFLKSKSPIYLNAFSSKDGNPNTKIADSKSTTTTTYKPCRKSGGRTRESYDKCLSQARAKEMVRRLVENLPELKGIFTPYGGGYKISSNSWTPNSTDHDNSTTIKDRYFEVAEWPTYNYQEKPEPIVNDKKDENPLFNSYRHPKNLEPVGEWAIGEELGIGNQVIPFWKAKNNKNILVLMDQITDIFDSVGINLGSKLHGYYGWADGGLNGKYKFKVKVSDKGVSVEDVLDGPLFFKGWESISDPQQDVTRGAQTEFHRAIVSGKSPFFEVGWVNFIVGNNTNRRGRAYKDSKRI